MESMPIKDKEKKGSQLSQAAISLGEVSKASLSCSEELLTRISAELTDEALFIAGYHTNPVPTKKKQTQDRGTQISKHVLFTKTRGTDTCSDRIRTCTKAHLLPPPHDKTFGNMTSESLEQSELVIEIWSKREVAFEGLTDHGDSNVSDRGCYFKCPRTEGALPTS